jgi:23S rRNA (guanine745-N1)-methyltransferase
MTPYYYKTGAKDQEKLKALAALDTEIEFGIDVYRKITNEREHKE